MPRFKVSGMLSHPQVSLDLNLQNLTLKRKVFMMSVMNQMWFVLNCKTVYQLDKKIVFYWTSMFQNTVWSEGFLYKVAPLELKISPIMYFVMYNSVVLSKILKIVVP